MDKRLAKLLCLAIWLALVHHGRSTAHLGERIDSYCVLDDTVKPFLIAK